MICFCNCFKDTNWTQKQVEVHMPPKLKKPRMGSHTQDWSLARAVIKKDGTQDKDSFSYSRLPKAPLFSFSFSLKSAVTTFQKGSCKRGEKEKVM